MPNYARITDWQAVDAGKSQSLTGHPGPGQHKKVYGKGKPLLDYDPGCAQLKCFDELAQTVETREVVCHG